MIPIPSVQIYSFYVCLSVCILIVLWIREEFRRRSSYDWSVVRERLYYCDNCHLSFLASHDGENVTRCPRCNELCFIRKRKHF